MADKRIGMYQGKTDYPTLHIIITSNPTYQTGRMLTESIEEALKKIEAWLRKNLK